MRARIFDGRGNALRDLVEYELGSVTYGLDQGETTLTLSKRSRDYESGPGWWHEGVTGHLLYLDMDNGLPDWCGVIIDANDTGDSLELAVAQAQYTLKRTGIARLFRYQDGPKHVATKALGACRLGDGFPLELGDVDGGDVVTRNRVQPQSLYSFIDTYSKRLGWEWTVRPEITSAGKVRLNIDLNESFGTPYGRTAGFAGGVTIQGDGLSRLVSSSQGVNHVVAVGKGATNSEAPVVEVQATRDIDNSYRRTSVVAFGEIADKGHLRAAARAELARRLRSSVTVAATVNSGQEASLYGLCRLGNTFTLDLPYWTGDVRLMGMEWEPTSNSVKLALRHSRDISGETIDEL